MKNYAKAIAFDKRYLLKILLMSNLSILLLFCSVFTAFAAESTAQKVKLNIELTNAPLNEVISEIKTQTNFEFAYEADLGNMVLANVSVNVNNESIENVLGDILDGSKVNFRVIDRIILLSKNNLQSTSDVNNSSLVPVKVSGKVTNEKGEPIPGVSITIKGTTNGTVTNVDGKYTLEVADASRILVFSFIGMTPQEITVGAQSVIDVVLVQTVVSLDEFVVIGYGTVRKSDLTGAVSSIKPKDIMSQPAIRIDQALAGKAPGVMVLSNDGQPGGLIKVRIRGANSITQSNDPLYVIDGFIGADITSFNVNDLESIEILQDASATAIYGSRGANGVVLITTRSGKTQQPRIDFASSFSLNQLPRKMDLMNAYEFATTINEQQEDAGQQPRFTADDLNSLRIHSTDWQDAIYRNAWSKDYQLSLTGGTKSIGYYISGGYSDIDGILINTNEKRTSLRTKLNAHINDDLSVNLNLYATQRDGTNNGYTGEDLDPAGQALLANPMMPIYGSDGTFNLYSMYGSTWTQPYSRALLANLNNLQNSFNGNISLDYEIIKGLKLTVQAMLEQRYELRRFSTTPENSIEKSFKASTENSRSKLFQNTNILTYTKSIRNIHSFTINAIYENSSNVYEYISAGSNSMITGSNQYYNLSLGNPTNSSDYLNDAIQSFVGRLNYGLLNRYLFTATYRNDGSSRFSEENRYSGFPSFAVAWRVSEEPFMKKFAFIDDFRIRASYGKTGNQNIAQYSTLNLLGSSAPYSWDGSSLVTGVNLLPPTNKRLKWETTASENIGIDASMFSNRVTFNADFYIKKTTDLLMQVPVPDFMGGGTYLDNVGTTENKGFAFNLGLTPVSKKDINWNLSLNFSTNRNKILELYGDVTQLPVGYYSFIGNLPCYIIEAGKPMGNLYGLKSLGTWKTSEVTEAAKYGQKPGMEKFLDLNNDEVIDGSDYMILGNSTPKYIFGLSNNLTFKNFTLSAQITGVQGFDIWNKARRLMQGGQGDARNATAREYMNRWRPSNETDMPASTSENISSRWVEDASFIRLSNLNLTYRLPASYLNKLHIKSAEIYISGQNLYTLTKFTGYDPEGSQSSAGSGGDANGAVSMSNIPKPRSLTIGLKIGLE